MRFNNGVGSRFQTIFTCSGRTDFVAAHLMIVVYEFAQIKPFSSDAQGIEQSWSAGWIAIAGGLVHWHH